jgi:hypothetical protein
MIGRDMRSALSIEILAMCWTNAAPQALRVAIDRRVSSSAASPALGARSDTHHTFPRVGTKGVNTALATADLADHAKAMSVMIRCK